jgi:predicted DNA-binding protein
MVKNPTAVIPEPVAKKTVTIRLPPELLERIQSHSKGSLSHAIAFFALKGVEQWEKAK